MIDRQTVEKIKDAANIVDVVSEFVTLRKSGASYKGLCPFHNEKTPSFTVSPSRNTCHCFGCGKGGTPITFIMEHEQMTYPEALRWLANKYHIEIVERELSDAEKEEQSNRESMFIINEFALKYFQDTLHNTPDGVAIGMQYFRQRGIRDDIIREFQLGFDPNDRLAFARTAQQKGYKPEFIEKVGICYKNERGELIDRYAGRVIFPWIGVSGKVVGFGGRKLDAATKGVQQKYVNSPDSDIYHKDRELYGLYQAKRDIAKEDCVYMVEGYTDVIAMHQAGIKNVVANSGTALSLHQIHILRRFTQNIILLYDGDSAGIHAALRGTDMLLAEGMNLKVLLLPDGDDPDSFARKHTASDFKQYIEEHQTDFIQFKTDLLLRNERDPLKRSEAINSIVKSISVVQNPILRDTYLHDCAQRIGINEATLINQMNRFIRNAKDNKQQGGDNSEQQPIQEAPAVEQGARTPGITDNTGASEKVERMIVQMIIKYGEQVIFENVETEDGKTMNLTVAQFFAYNLGEDGLRFSNELFNRILDEATEKCTENGTKAETYFINHEDIKISQIAVELSEDQFHLTESRQPRMDVETLQQQAMHLVLDFRMDYLDKRLKEIRKEIANAQNNADRTRELMTEFMEKSQMRNALATKIGSNIIL
ncbi:MAG: DNA primase [Prevotella sp.]|nr:DNA primase [Prevotella sp.]